MSMSYGGDTINDTDGGVLRPISSVMRNRIINGAMVIDQRNAGASVTVNSGTNAFIVDRWFANGQSADGVFTGQKVTTAPTGFINSMQFTVTTADTSIGASQSYVFRQRIEGFNTADLGWGTANASACTISFWVRSSVTGNFGGSIFNGDGNRIYPFSFTISAANTFEYKTITIAGDTSGTWYTTNDTSINLVFSLGVGSSNKGTAGAWSSTFAFAPTGSVDLIATSGATFYITGVQLEKGTQATGFEYRQYGTELALCQRYFAKLTYDGTGGEVVLGTGQQTATTDAWVYTKYPVTMRAEPTASISSLALSNFRSFASAATLTAIYAGFDCGTIRCSMSASGALDAAILLQIQNNTAGFLALSSEL